MTVSDIMFFIRDKFDNRLNSNKNDLYEWHLRFAEKSENKGYLVRSRTVSIKK